MSTNRRYCRKNIKLYRFARKMHKRKIIQRKRQMCGIKKQGETIVEAAIQADIIS